MSGALARVVVASAALAGAAGGCSLLVAGDVADFKCGSSEPSACPSGMSCDLATGRCIDGEAGTVEPAEASDEDASDALAPVDSGRDADAATGPLALGAKCRVDLDCKSRLCGSSTILTTTITQSTGPICTTPCCGSSECAPSFVCFNGGTGGGYCVPAALAQRQPPASGGKAGGATCAANTDCRSGLCTGSPLRCLDTCCAQSECDSATTCRLQTVAAHDVWVCAPANAGATGQPGDACTFNSDCASDNCIGFSSKLCRPPCSNSASCKTVAGFASGHCLYGSSGPDEFKFCYATTSTSASAAGAPCLDSSTCQSDYCDGELKTCANVCGRDADCAVNEKCRPSATGIPLLRCVPAP